MSKSLTDEARLAASGASKPKEDDNLRSRTQQIDILEQMIVQIFADLFHRYTDDQFFGKEFTGEGRYDAATKNFSLHLWPVSTNHKGELGNIPDIAVEEALQNFCKELCGVSESIFQDEPDGEVEIVTMGALASIPAFELTAKLPVDMIQLAYRYMRKNKLTCVDDVSAFDLPRHLNDQTMEHRLGVLTADALPVELDEDELLENVLLSGPPSAYLSTAEALRNGARRADEVDFNFSLEAASELGRHIAQTKPEFDNGPPSIFSLLLQ